MIQRIHLIYIRFVYKLFIKFFSIKIKKKCNKQKIKYYVLWEKTNKPKKTI